MPFIKLSASALKNELQTKSNSTDRTPKCIDSCNQCTLCVQCNSDCEECATCPDNFRVCPDCSTVCNYLGIHELNTAFSEMKLNDLSLVHVNIRSLSKNLNKFENMLDRLDQEPDIICITETRLNESITPNSDQSVQSDPKVIQLPGYKFSRAKQKIHCKISPKPCCRLSVAEQIASAEERVLISRPALYFNTSFRICRDSVCSHRTIRS